ncbi:uroporphyrin-III C-methyltransferase [Schizophyllum commune]
MGFPKPQGGASLMLTFKLANKTVLIVGGGTVAATRAFAALEADSSVVVVVKKGKDAACEELKWRADEQQITLLDWDKLPTSSTSENDVQALDAYLASLSSVSFVCVTDTVLGYSQRSRTSAEQIYNVCRARNIPVNTTDIPQLCDFSFTATHRFEHHETGQRSPIQIGVTTNGQGCRLAGRVKRDIIASIPKEIGAAVEKVGYMRSTVKDDLPEEDEHACEDGSTSTPNRPVPQRMPSDPETPAEQARRRMKWVAQVSEYWPIHKLAAMTAQDMAAVLSGDSLTVPRTPPTEPTLHSLGDPERQGRILLVGSGPGHPSLLTVATRDALTTHADLVLSDKLVPAAVLELIPSNVEVRIARKFPGNNDGAQNEMMEQAVEAARAGRTVVRLKQGDPVVYGRAGEEVLYFREHGFEPVVIPGVSSALAGPTFAGVPVTQRGVAESLMVCTGVGRKGRDVQLPGYERARTTVILMGVARLPQVVAALTDPAETARRSGPAYPLHTPIAIVERASMPDQRVVYSTLKDIVLAMESSGEQRPPGMIVLGWAVLALWEKGDVEVLEEGGENNDEERVKRWLGEDAGWRVREGLDAQWAEL